MSIILNSYSKNVFYLVFLGLSFSFFACKRENTNRNNSTVETQKEAAPEAEADENASAKLSQTAKGKSSFDNDFISSTAANIEKVDSSKRFIKTADLRFRVKDALKSSIAIEDIALHNKGFVMKSTLFSNEQNSKTIDIGHDSLREIKTFVIANNIELRVPSKQLDTTIRAIAQQIDYLEHRKINAEDATFKLLDKTLQEKRRKQYVQSANNQGRSNTGTERSERILEVQIAADEAFVEKTQIEDAIRYSTIQLYIYQAPTTRFYTIANTNKSYQSPFWINCKEALIDSWTIVETLFFLCLRILLPCLLLFGLFKSGRWFWKANFSKKDPKGTAS